MKLAFELDRVTLTVRNMEAGQGVEEVEIDYSDEPFEIGFNARYLLDVAGQITGETADFRFADPASPTLVLDPGDAGRPVRADAAAGLRPSRRNPRSGR